MPKLKPSPLEIRRRTVRACIAKYLELNGMTKEELGKRLGVSEQTVYNRKNRPETLHLHELWAIIKILHISDEDILQMFKC